MKDDKTDIRKDRELCVYCRFNEEGKCYQPKGICPYVEIVLKYQDIASQAERKKLLKELINSPEVLFTKNKLEEIKKEAGK